MKNRILVIDENNYPVLIETVCRRDADLQKVVADFGVPPIWIRPAGFPTLVHIILEQQVSLASARATYEKLKLRIGDNFAPADFLLLADDELRLLGFSRQKTLYVRNLANAVETGELNLNRLEKLNDEDVKNKITKLKGIGQWTADVYLLMCLRRADVFPIGDLGLIVGAQTVKKLPERPTGAELLAMSEVWKPYRAVATRVIWHYYLSKIRPYKNY